MKYFFIIVISAAIAFTAGYHYHAYKSASVFFNKKREYRKLDDLFDYAATVQRWNNKFLLEQILAFKTDSISVKSGIITSAYDLALLSERMYDTLKVAEIEAINKGGGYLEINVGGYNTMELRLPFDTVGSNYLVSSGIAANIEGLMRDYALRSDMALGYLFIDEKDQKIALPATTSYNKKWGIVTGRKDWVEYYFKNTSLSSTIITLRALEYNQATSLNIALNHLYHKIAKCNTPL